MTKRKAITPAMKIDCVIYRGLVRCGICNNLILYGDKIEWDHIHALVHGGGHDFTNIRPLHAECHKPKTKADIQANAKVKRLRCETKTGPKKQIQSPGFDKTKTRKFSGKVVPRAARQKQNWARCPSTHCERRQECASPNGCIVEGKD